MRQTHLRLTAEISSLLVCFALVSVHANPSNGYEDESTTMMGLEFARLPSLTILPWDHDNSSTFDPASLLCKISGAQGQVWWTKDETNMTDLAGNSNLTLTSKIEMPKEDDNGTYTCMARTMEGKLLNRTIHLKTTEPHGITVETYSLRVRLYESATLSCDVQGYPLVDWQSGLLHLDDRQEHSNRNFSYFTINETYTIMHIHFRNVTNDDNGLYQCCARDIKYWWTCESIYLVVIEAPRVSIEFVKAVGPHSIYLRWTAEEGQDALQSFELWYLKEDEEKFQQYDEIPIVGKFITSYTMSGLENGTAYQLALAVSNSIGYSDHAFSEVVTTWEKDPEYTPPIWCEATTLDSIAVRWAPPPPELRDYIRHFHVTLLQDHKWVYAEIRRSESINFVDLHPETRYRVSVVACNHYTGVCEKWYAEEEVITKDRDPKFVPSFSGVAKSSPHSITISWSIPPPELQHRVYHYKVMATYHGETTELVYLNRTVNSYTFENLTSKTSYVLKVAACGEFKTQCGNWSAEQEVLTIEEEGAMKGAIWMSVIAILVLVVFVLIVCLVIRKRREKVLRKKFMDHYSRVALDCLDPELNMGEQAELLPYNKKWEFPRKLLKLDKVLGSGAFGIVRKAEAKSICRGQAVTTVAVKMVRATASLNYMTALSRELKILCYLGKHPNVVNLLGACTKNVSYGELFVIVEFCRFGNLRDYLLNRRADFVGQIDSSSANSAVSNSDTTDSVNANDRAVVTQPHENADSTMRECSQGKDFTSPAVEDVVPVTDSLQIVCQSKYEGDYEDESLEPICEGDLKCWAFQIARGMKYLGERRVLHGDLAARNVLLADNNIVKICDFGLSKSLRVDENYKKKGQDPLPLKWMAIESIRDRIFSVRSDIWSYGIVLWEIFSLAQTPYPGIRSENVYQKLVDGFRMPQPKYANDDIYHMMLQCWETVPSERPSFEKLAHGIADVLDESVKMHYLQLNGSYMQMNTIAPTNNSTDYATILLAEDAHCSKSEPTS